MKTILLLTFFISCTTNTYRNNYPRNKVRESGKVLKALMSSGLTPDKSALITYYTARNVSCLKDLVANNWKCTFPGPDKIYTIPPKESEDLAGVLLNLPVPQGDTGAVTLFLQCRTYDNQIESAECDVAIALDYPGP